MNARWLLILTFSLFATVSCTKKIKPPAAAAQSSNARIAIEVEQSTLTAPALKKDLEGKLRETILATKVGVPAADPTKADLLLKYSITRANFTHATKWQWQLVDIETGAVVASQTDESAFGASAESLANQAATELAALDTARFANDTAPVVNADEARRAKAEPRNTALDAPASGTSGENAWAVVIGIEDYREELAPATGAEADARAFADYARRTLNVPEANLKMLLGERASRADLSAALMEWLPRNAVEPDGRVYVFFSGHGTPDVESGEAYLLPYDANPTYVKSGGLRVDEVQTKLASLQGQQVYLFLDACFSGQGERSVLPKGTRPVVPVQQLNAAEGVVTFSASRADETTGADPSGRHGLFTHHLLGGLTGGADSNGDGDVTIAELREHLVSTVTVAARRQNRDQTPTVAVPASLNASHVLVDDLER